MPGIVGLVGVIARPASTSLARSSGAEWSGACIAAILLIAAATKFAIAWVTPLTSDECFHWLQGRHLAWGYSDHPPGTAVLGRLTTEWLGNTWLGLRLAPIVGSLVCSLIAFAMLREVGADPSPLCRNRASTSVVLP